MSFAYVCVWMNSAGSVSIASRAPQPPVDDCTARPSVGSNLPAVRWDRLFDDLEAQLDAADAADLAGEVQERTRIERGHVVLADRLDAWRGQALTVHLAGGCRLDGPLLDAAAEWLVLGGVAPTLVVLDAITGLSGLGSAAAGTGRDSVRRRYSLVAVLRAVARDRSPVRAGLVDGTVLTGTVDAVAADHLDLAEHAGDEPRRPAAVRGVRAVPLRALATVQPAAGTTMLGTSR